LNSNSDITGLAAGIVGSSTLFWADSCTAATTSCANPGQIGQVSPSDPSKPLTTPDGESPLAIAVSTFSSKPAVYWIDSTHDVQVSPIPLGSSTPIASGSPASTPQGVAASSVDGAVAWTDSAGNVWMLRTDGVRVRLAATAGNPTAIVLDDDRAYWISGNSVAWTWR
jgi:hypothetical protein